MSQVSKNAATCLVATSVVFTSAAQLLFSLVMKRVNVDVGSIIGVLTSLPAMDIAYLVLGVVLYAASMLVWIVALTRFPVSLAYPMLSSSYVLVYAVAAYLPAFHETASMMKTLGVGLVAAGISVLFLDRKLGN